MRVRLPSTRSRVLAVNLVLLLALSVLLFANNIYFRRQTLARTEERLDETVAYVHHWFDSSISSVKNALYRIRSADEVILAAVSTRQDHTYFERVKRIMDRLRIIRTDVPFIEDIYVYLTNHDRVISHDGTRDFDVYALSWLGNSRSSIGRGMAEDVPHTGALVYAPQSIIVVVPMPRHGAAVAELNAAEIGAHISALNSIPGTILMIHLGDVPIYWARPTGETAGIVAEGVSEPPYKPHEDPRIRWISRRSAESELTYSAIYDPGLLLRRLRDANTYTVLAFVLILFFNILAALYYRRIFAPLEGLLERVGRPTHADNDLRFLSREFMKIQTSNERLRREISTHHRTRLEILLSRAVMDGRHVDLARFVSDDQPASASQRAGFVFAFAVSESADIDQARIAEFEQRLEATCWTARLPVHSEVQGYLIVRVTRGMDAEMNAILGRLVHATVGSAYMGASKRVPIEEPIDVRELWRQSVAALESLPAGSVGPPMVCVHDPRAPIVADRGMTLADEQMLIDTFTAGDVDGIARRIAAITDPVRLTVGEMRRIIVRLHILLRVIVRSRGGNAAEIGIAEVAPEGYRLRAHTVQLAELYRLAAARCAAQDRSLLTKITEFVEENYSTGIGTTEVARALGMTPGYISSYFHRHTSERLVHYIHAVCIRSAADMIRRRPDTPVSEVARAVGMANPNTFIRNFKRLKGCTPGEYRHDLARR